MALLETYDQLETLRKKFLEDTTFRRSLATTCALVQFKTNDQQIEFVNAFTSKAKNCL